MMNIITNKEHVVNKLLHKMFEEEKDFYHYADLAADCDEPAWRSTLTNIAKQEREHYKMLYDAVFAAEPTTPFERAIKEHSWNEYLHMEDKLNKINK